MPKFDSAVVVAGAGVQPGQIDAERSIIDGESIDFEAAAQVRATPVRR